MAKVVLILGIVGVLFGGIVLLVSVALPLMSSHTSWDEAMFGIIPGALILIGSFVVAAIGLVLVLAKRKKTTA